MERISRKNKDSGAQKSPRGKRRAMAILVSILGAVIGAALVGLLLVAINSTGKLDPLKDKQGNAIPGSISEKAWLEVGGIRQGMFIRGENPENPVFLYVHGGPGTPMLQFISYLEKIGEMDADERLEKYFTVCYWDQRGAGMTYSKSTDPATMATEQMVEDTREVTEYLKSRFGQDKIYLVGHSWGSYLGVKTLEKYPENYLAYIGIGQVTNSVESERLSYEYMLGRAKEIGDEGVIKMLGKYDPHAEGFPFVQEDGHTFDYLMARTDALNKYGNAHMHRFPKGMTFKGAIFLTLFDFKGYTLREKINWLRGVDFSFIYLFPLVMNDDLFVSSAKFDVPFYIVQEAHDYQVSQVLAEKYLYAIDAPKKEFFMFDNSAHSPNLEESERFVEIIREIAAKNGEKSA
jgi:pimeloyl-ACP methyl ester carboxylesterase